MAAGDGAARASGEGGDGATGDWVRAAMRQRGGAARRGRWVGGFGVAGQDWRREGGRRGQRAAMGWDRGRGRGATGREGGGAGRSTAAARAISGGGRDRRRGRNE